MWRCVGAAVVLGMALHVTSAIPLKGVETQPPYPDCDILPVPYGIRMKYPEVMESLEMAIWSSDSWLNLNIDVGPDMYMVVAEGTKLTLSYCKGGQGNACTELRSANSGKGGPNLIDSNNWNYVNVDLIDDKLEVSINARAVVKGDTITQNATGQVLPIVTLVAQKDGYTDTFFQFNYCNLTMPVQVMMTNGPPVTQSPNDIPYPMCPIYEVTAVQPMPAIPLHDTLRFAVYPTMSMMLIKVQLSHALYKASVEGTYINLMKCDVLNNSQCENSNTGGTKDKDLLVPNTWNYIDVILQDGEISISVNRETNVMGETMKMEGQDEEALVTFMLSDSDRPTTLRDGYQLTVNVMCNVTMPDQAMMTNRPPVTQSPNDIPYPTCPTHQVTAAQPMPHIALHDTLSFAVYPTMSMMLIKVQLSHALYKASVEGTMINLMKCDAQNNSQCDTVNTGGTKGKDLLVPNSWNDVDVMLQDGEISISVNNETNVMGETMEMEGQDEEALVTFMLSDSDRPTTLRDGYQLTVNVMCNDTFVPSSTVMPAPISEAVGNTTPATPGEEDGTSTVGIIVGVLAAILILVAIAVTVSCMRKSRSMEVNQHTQLQNQ